MKKIKLLTPMLTITALTAVAAPVITSCAQITSGVVIPTDLLNIVGYTLKGFKSGVDLSNYNTLYIPEGVKYIDDNAFADVFVAGSKTNIQVIVLPTSLREIRKDAFKNCDSVRVIYMNNWSADNIYYLSVAEGALAGMSHIGQVVLGDNLTDEGKEKAKSLLSETGGLNSIWFENESEDKMTADAAWKVQKKTGAKNASYLFTCNVALPEGTKIYAQVTRTNSTKYVDVECDKLTTVKDSNVFELNVSLMNQAETDDFAEFAITFAAVKEVLGSEDTFLWKQTLTGFKLINIKGDTPEPTPGVNTFDFENITVQYPEMEPTKEFGIHDKAITQGTPITLNINVANWTEEYGKPETWPVLEDENHFEIGLSLDDENAKFDLTNVKVYVDNVDVTSQCIIGESGYSILSIWINKDSTKIPTANSIVKVEGIAFTGGTKVGGSFDYVQSK